jgi:inner membrane protein
VDSITQAALGGVVGELVLGRKIGWKGMAWGLLFGTIPDLDLLFMPFLDQAERLRWHRGISHSIVMMVVAALVCAKPLAWVHQEKGVSARRAGWFVFLAWSTHVLIDVFTSYGTQVFEPFSDRRVAWSNVFIIDLFFTLPLLLSLFYWPWKVVAHAWAGRSWRKEGGDPDEKPEFPEFTRRSATGAIAVSSLYVVFTLVMKLWAVDQMKTQMAEAVPDGVLVTVSPTVSNAFLWRGLIETKEGYFLTYWSPFDDGTAWYDYIPKQRELAEKFEGEKMFEALKWFTQGHWVARELPDGKVVMIDMRLGEVRDLEGKQMLPIFQWRMRYDEDGRSEVRKYRPQDFEIKKALGLILERIGGKRTEWEAMDSF